MLNPVSGKLVKRPHFKEQFHQVNPHSQINVCMKQTPELKVKINDFPIYSNDFKDLLNYKPTKRGPNK